MEKMPYTPEMDAAAMLQPVTPTSVVTTDWRTGLPVLTGTRVTLREMRVSDAPSLFAMLTTEEVARFISPPPTTVEGFERFIMWANRERAAGTYACFAIVPHGMDTAIGIFQVRQIEPAWGTAEWGFAIGSPFWGTGAFADGAKLVLDFVFETIGVHRLEAVHADGLEREVEHELGAVRERSRSPERRPNREAPLRGSPSRLDLPDLEDPDRGIHPVGHDGEAGVGSCRALPIRPHDEALEALDRRRRRRNEPRHFFRREHREQRRRIRYAHLAQRHARAGEDRQARAPVGCDDRRGCYRLQHGCSIHL